MNPELEQCSLFVEYIERHSMYYPDLAWMFHICNEGKRKGNISKIIGIKPGVADYCLPVPSGGYNGLYIEMKAPKKKIKGGSEQEKFASFVKEHGYAFGCFDNWKDAGDFVINYIERKYNRNGLKPCPFCHSNDIEMSIGDGRRSTKYECLDCGIKLETGETFFTINGSLWNERNKNG